MRKKVHVSKISSDVKRLAKKLYFATSYARLESRLTKANRYQLARHKKRDEGIFSAKYAR